MYGGAGASFSYHRGDAVHPENIWANGPLGEPVDLMASLHMNILFRGLKCVHIINMIIILLVYRRFYPKI